MKMHRILLIAGIVCLAAGLAGAVTPVQWRVEDGGNGHFYEYVADVEVRWTNARDAASARTYGGASGYLATITSAEEHAFFLADLSPAFNEAWLGGWQESNKPAAEGWHWLTGEAWGFTNWSPKEPNDAGSGEEYLSVWGNQIWGGGSFGIWNDESNNSHLYITGYFVEYAPPSPVQWRVEDGGNGHYYEYVPATDIHWSDARDAAAARTYRGESGHLATTTSAAEIDFMSENLTDDFNEAWLGGWQEPGMPGPDGWHWVTGEPWDYTKWDTGEPNDFGGGEEYLGFRGGQSGNDLWHWNDDHNNSVLALHGYFVEYVPEPATVSLLALGGMALIRRRNK